MASEKSRYTDSPGLADAVALVAHLLRGARRDVARHEVAEAGYRRSRK